VKTTREQLISKQVIEADNNNNNNNNNNNTNNAAKRSKKNELFRERSRCCSSWVRVPIQALCFCKESLWQEMGFFPAACTLAILAVMSCRLLLFRHRLLSVASL
jgi:hypothetical protein